MMRKSTEITEIICSMIVGKWEQRALVEVRNEYLFGLKRKHDLFGKSIGIYL